MKNLNTSSLKITPSPRLWRTGQNTGKFILALFLATLTTPHFAYMMDESDDSIYFDASDKMPDVKNSDRKNLSTTKHPPERPRTKKTESANIGSLPPEMWNHILSFLPNIELVNPANTCHQLHTLSIEQKIRNFTDHIKQIIEYDQETKKLLLDSENSEQAANAFTVLTLLNDTRQNPNNSINNLLKILKRNQKKFMQRQYDLLQDFIEEVLNQCQTNQTYTNSLLKHVIDKNQLQTITTLLNHGVDVNTRLGLFNLTPAMQALLKGKFRILNEIFKRGGLLHDANLFTFLSNVENAFTHFAENFDGIFGAFLDNDNIKILKIYLNVIVTFIALVQMKQINGNFFTNHTICLVPFTIYLFHNIFYTPLCYTIFGRVPFNINKALPPFLLRLTRTIISNNYYLPYLLQFIPTTNQQEKPAETKDNDGYHTEDE